MAVFVFSRIVVVVRNHAVIDLGCRHRTVQERVLTHRGRQVEVARDAAIDDRDADVRSTVEAVRRTRGREVGRFLLRAHVHDLVVERQPRDRVFDREIDECVGRQAHGQHVERAVAAYDFATERFDPPGFEELGVLLVADDDPGRTVAAPLGEAQYGAAHLGASRGGNTGACRIGRIGFLAVSSIWRRRSREGRGRHAGWSVVVQLCDVDRRNARDVDASGFPHPFGSKRRCRTHRDMRGNPGGRYAHGRLCRVVARCECHGRRDGQQG